MFQYAYLYSQAKEGVIPDIYVQGENYFEKYKEDIKTLFSADIGYEPYVSIHVRRGDYVNNPFYVDLMETNYYKKAMSLFPEDKFLVFSDDIEWCKEQAIFKGCIFSERNDEVTDLNRMASCKHNIIANSSFSWWAAWLNPNTEKKVVAPREWFTDKEERISLPDTWIKI